MPIREIKFPPKVMRRAKPSRPADGRRRHHDPRRRLPANFPDGSVAEMKMFHAHDGAGIKLAGIMGIRTGLITGRDSPATLAAPAKHPWNL